MVLLDQLIHMRDVLVGKVLEKELWNFENFVNEKEVIVVVE